MKQTFEPYSDNSDSSETAGHLFAEEPHRCPTKYKESTMNDLIPTSIEQKIAQAVEKLRHLKEEKEALEKRVIALERALHEKDAEIERMTQEKNTVKSQIETLLNELDSLSAGA